MGKRDMKNKTPPSGAKSQSLVLRLNTRLFFRQLGIFLCMDLLLVVLALMGQLMWAEKRCADVAQLVQERGVPTAEAVPWMAASDYTIIPLDREPKGVDVGELGWFSGGEATADGLRTYVLFSYYTVELPNGGEPYAITVDLSGIGRMLKWAGFILLTVQIISLIANLFRNAGTIRRTLRPIQELAATAARLNSMTHMSRRELEALAGELSKINATHLDSRIDLPGTQKELKTLAKAINDMLDRVNAAYSAQMQFVSDASHELRTPIAVIQGYAALLDRWGKDDPEARQEAIDAIRSESDAMERLVEQLLFLARGDNDTQPIRPQLMDLTAVAEDVLREEQMIHPERAFLARWQGPVVVRADPGLVKQVMRILMDNSVKYSGPEGRVYLRVSAQKDYARVTVQDEGMGIVPQAIPHIFDRFYRTDSSRARQTGGTGLGLSIARWIVDRRLVRGGLPGGRGHPHHLCAPPGGDGMSWWVYLLRCGDGTLYTGITDDLDRRLAAHNAGRGAKYTRSRRPVTLVWREEQPDKSAALRREYAVKQLTRAKKLALIEGGPLV